MNNQITLGELITKIEHLDYDEDQDSPEVFYDFGRFSPSEVMSYRGFYEQLAINYGKGDSEGDRINVTDFLSLLENTVGKVFEGYKGGDYVMARKTPLWVANYGESGWTAMVDAKYNNGRVMLITEYCEY